jgi:hypothetical protein
VTIRQPSASFSGCKSAQWLPDGLGRSTEPGTRWTTNGSFLPNGPKWAQFAEKNARRGEELLAGASALMNGVVLDWLAEILDATQPHDAHSGRRERPSVAELQGA